MNRISWIAALGLAVSLLPAAPALAADHLDGASVKQDPSTDINDVYSWMSTDKSKVYLAMTVFPAADKATAKFSTAAYSKTALGWAEKNLGWLKSTAALTLATEAASAAGESARACSFATQLQEQSKHLADREKVIAVRAFLACGQKERAAALLPPVQ